MSTKPIVAASSSALETAASIGKNVANKTVELAGKIISALWVSCKYVGSNAYVALKAASEKTLELSKIFFSQTLPAFLNCAKEFLIVSSNTIWDFAKLYSNITWKYAKDGAEFVKTNGKEFINYISADKNRVLTGAGLGASVILVFWAVNKYFDSDKI